MVSCILHCLADSSYSSVSCKDGSSPPPQAPFISARQFWLSEIVSKEPRGAYWPVMASSFPSKLWRGSLREKCHVEWEERGGGRYDSLSNERCPVTPDPVFSPRPGSYRAKGFSEGPAAPSRRVDDFSVKPTFASSVSVRWLLKFFRSGALRTIASLKPPGVPVFTYSLCSTRVDIVNFNYNYLLHLNFATTVVTLSIYTLSNRIPSTLTPQT